MRLLRKKDVAARVGFSLSHVERMTNNPDYASQGFPKPTRIGFKVLWSEDEVEKWIEWQLSRRSAPK